MGSYGSRWAVIADDLTGACDTGVQFSQSGFSTLVWAGLEADPRDLSEVKVLTTASRHDSRAGACTKVNAACRLLQREKRCLIYKKIDSTFQGNPGPEIQAVMEFCGFGLALVAPAFPRMGRFVVNGRLQVAGSPECVDLEARLREQGVERVIALKPVDIDELTAIAGQGNVQVVMDTESQHDLNLIARKALAMEPPPLLVGSAGLAKETAAEMARLHRKRVTGPAEVCRRQNHGPVVLFIGSTNPVTLAQIERLMAGGAVGVSLTESERAQKALAAGRHIVVGLDLSAPEREHLTRFIGIVQEFPIAGVVLSGGETAMLVSRALGVKGIRPEQEIISGAPYGRFSGGVTGGMAVVTKAGGFGKNDALQEIVDFLVGI
jgi:uncharacterized protein YgbK (DUF1537 family)